ncbi:MAG TPA: anti-sigma factor [Streptosporangiaceae bacterium]|jgi:anti-sigma-K factor RskA
MRSFPGRNHSLRLRRADLHTLAGPYALNALPPRDRERFERHLAACPACAEEVRGLRETTARLAAATAAAPTDRLKEKVFAEVTRTRQLPPVSAGQPAAGSRWLAADRWVAAVRRRVRSGRQPWARPVALIAAGAFLVAAVVFGSMALITQHRLSQAQAGDHMLAAVLTAPDAKMTDTAVTGGGTATIVMSHLADALAFSSAHLPGLPAGKAYELWLMGPPGERSVGMLPHPAHGMTSPVVATGLHSGDMVELTVEPAGGSPHPTSAPVLLMVL